MNHIFQSVLSESVIAIGESDEDVRKRHIQLVQTLMLHMCVQELQYTMIEHCIQVFMSVIIYLVWVCNVAAYCLGRSSSIRIGK